MTPLCPASIQRRPAADRAVGRAVQYDAENGVDGPVRQSLGLRDEVAGRVVDENVERRGLPDFGEHGFNRVGVSECRIDGP